MVKRLLFACAAVGVAGFVLIAGAGPAAAKVDGGCTGSGTFTKGGFTVDASESGVVTVPSKDDVQWKAALPGQPAGDTAYSGSIEVKLPPPFGEIKIDDWSGTSDSAGNQDVKHYDLPSFIPGGVEFEVTGHHDEGNVHCKGTVRVKLDSSSLSVLSAGSLVGTALTGLALVFAGRAK